MRDKERLGEIKNSYLEGLHRLFGEPWVSMPKENFDWLINRVEELEEALEFYADQENYREHDLKGIVPSRPITYKPILHDYGSIARKALEGESDRTWIQF